MNPNNPTPSQNGNFGVPLVSFQLDKASIREKSDYNYGKQIAEYIMSLVNGGSSSYFWVRNQRWKTNRNYANGKINMSKFQDLLEFNGKVNYINLNWQPILIVNRICSGLVGRWMNRNEKIVVTATDTLSTKQKQEQFEELQFIVENRKMLEKLEAESGVQMIPQNQTIPGDQEELRLWQSQFQRLPEEILYELSTNDILAACGWFDVLKEKMLHDAAQTGFVGTYTWMDSEGVIHVEWLKPENCFYSYSNFPDFRDTTWRGYMRTLKISELRKKYGKEFNPNNPHALTENQLFDMAKTAKEYQLYDNITWNTEWNVTFLRPYDEWNVDVMEFELKTVDSEPYTVVTTKQNKSTIIKKGRPTKKADNEEVIEDSRINIYRGVYARSTQTMLEWGIKKNMIRPQDPKEIGNAEFSYTFYMAQNYDMTCIGVPEKIQEPADQMIIARLKIQQLVAKMKPYGAAINWDAIQNIDYGLGEGNKSIDVKKLYDQTGEIYYRGRDAEGNQIPVPIIELQNAGFYNQLRGLIELYQFHYQVMKDELGEDPNLIASAVQPRVTAGNVEVSQQQAEFATDYYYQAYVYCMNDTSRKISCLLKDSVTYGAKVYRNIIGDQDISSRVFSTRVNLLPTAFEIQKFEALLSQSLAANPDLNLFVNQFELMRIAKEDVKLAEALYRQAQKKMLIWQRETATQNQQQTIEGQIAAAQEAEKAKQETEALKGEVEIKKTQQIALAQNQSAVLNMFTGLMKPSGESNTIAAIPAELKPLWNAVIENIIVKSVVATEEKQQEVIAQMQQAQAEQQMQEQQQMEQQQMQQPNIQQQQPAA